MMFSSTSDSAGQLEPATLAHVPRPLRPHSILNPTRHHSKGPTCTMPHTTARVGPKAATTCIRSRTMTLALGNAGRQPHAALQLVPPP